MTTDGYTTSTAVRSAWHDIRGVRYHVSEWGDPADPLLVLLHGWGDCGATFQFLVDELQDDKFVIAPDWRGFGETRLQTSSYWFPDYLADLDALLANYNAERPVTLLGHSMGANVGGLYAGIFPERVSAFINIEGFGLRERPPEDAPDNYRNWIEKGRDPAPYRQFDDIQALAAHIQKRSPGLSAGRAEFVARSWSYRANDGTVLIKADPLHKLPNAVLYRLGEAVACWQRVTAPVLFVIGENSPFSGDDDDRFDGDVRRMGFRDVELRQIANAGHMVHFEQPAALAALVEEFVGLWQKDL